MSLFFVPTQSPFVVDRRHPAQHRHHHASHGGRCGSSLAAVQSPFDLVFGGQHGLNNYYQDQEDAYDVVAEQRVRQHYAALRRQAEAERERELRRRRIQQEQRRREAELAALAAAAAWQAEQERKQRALLERRRREREAAAAARKQWEQFALQGIAGALELASHFFDAFNEEEEVVGSGETTAQPSTSTESKEAPKNAEVQASEPSTAKASPDTEMGEAVKETTVDQSVAATEQTEMQEQAQTVAEQPAVSQNLVFSYPLPKDEFHRSSIKADDIKVDFDESTRTIQIKGLWDVNDGYASDSNSTISAQSDDGNTRGRKRSRSPKRSRVSDVDEKTGEEIVSTAERAEEVDQDGFVNVTKSSKAGKQAQGTARVPVPENADISSLRAELTDDGFRLYL